LPGVLLKTKIDQDKEIEIYTNKTKSLTKEEVKHIYEIYGALTPTKVSNAKSRRFE
jgi:hypothetical protein